jgi:uncharacterized protein YdeI (BOF family)
MNSLRRNLIDTSVLSAIVLAFALAWGSPFVTGDSAFGQQQAQPQPQQQPDQKQSKTGTFTGTVVKNGDSYLLRDSSGMTYGLDDAERAKPYEGKTVKVTGELDEQARMIHVESIVSVEG